MHSERTNQACVAPLDPSRIRAGVRERRATDVLILVGSVGVFIATFALRFDPARPDHVMTPAGKPIGSVCWFREVTTVSCPTCGLTRSFVALSHGYWLDACRRNVFGPLVFLLVAAQIPYRLFRLLGRAPASRPRHRAPARALGVPVAALLAFAWLVERLVSVVWPLS